MDSQTGRCFAKPPIGIETQQLEEIVKRRLGGRVRHLRVEIVDNGLILHGLTPTYHAKQLAQDAILRASRRPLLGNRIAVVREGPREGILIVS